MRTSVMTSAMVLGCATIFACGASPEASPSRSSPPPATSPPPPAALPVATVPPYEVHEWGLVRGGVNDSIVLGGTVPEMMPMAVEKPLLYFHLGGDGPLDVDVTARMGEGGSIIESWPLAGPAGARAASWHGRVTRGSCHHGRLPAYDEAPCAGLLDGCEASALGGVESEDADCVAVGSQSANHLFYRGSIVGVDPLPLVIERLADGRIRVRNRGAEPIPGVLLRVRLAYSMAGVTGGATRAAPPPPGATVEVGVPSGSTAEAAAQVSIMLLDLGLTLGEAAAFRRAWDAPLFGVSGSAADLPVQTSPGRVRPVHAEARAAPPPLVMAPPAPRTTDSLVYFLPPAVIEQLSTLELSPRPTRVRRAIAVWLDLPTP